MTRHLISFAGGVLKMSHDFKAHVDPPTGPKMSADDHLLLNPEKAAEALKAKAAPKVAAAKATVKKAAAKVAAAAEVVESVAEKIAGSDAPAPTPTEGSASSTESPENTGESVQSASDKADPAA